MVESTLTSSALPALAGVLQSRLGCSVSWSLPSTELAHQRIGDPESAATALKTVIKPSQAVITTKRDVCRMSHVIAKPGQASNLETCVAPGWPPGIPVRANCTLNAISKIVDRGTEICAVLFSDLTIEQDEIDIGFVSLPSSNAHAKIRSQLATGWERWPPQTSRDHTALTNRARTLWGAVRILR